MDMDASGMLMGEQRKMECLWENRGKWISPCPKMVHPQGNISGL
jgi:hypothetical protein